MQTRFTVQLQSMRDINGKWHVAAYLPKYIKRRTKRHDRGLRAVLQRFTQECEGYEGIIGDGLVWTMLQEGFKPTLFMRTYECPNFHSDWDCCNMTVIVNDDYETVF